MELEMEELFIESVNGEEIDFDYEYDADKYYDFSREETDVEAQQAERWFATEEYYPPSPLIIKLKWEPSGNTSFVYKAADLSDEATSEHNTGSDSYSPAKSPRKSTLLKQCNFMNPTASQSAKQNCPAQILCQRLLRRSQKVVKYEEKITRSISLNGTQPAKRQKLEAGYSRKAARLKHQAIFSHKPPKKVGLIEVHTPFAKPKVTIPKEPNLETSIRAERHRSKINLESGETTKSNACTFKARPLNKKILEAPSFPLPTKSTPQLPEFQLFHLRTSERAMQHTSVHANHSSFQEANAPYSSPAQQNETVSYRRVTPIAALKKKLEALDKFKDRCLSKKECNFPMDKRFPNEPPIESFSKLSLTSEVQSNENFRSKMALHSKGSKENAPSSFTIALEMKNAAKSKRLGGNLFQCGSKQTVPPVVQQINRSLDIR